MREVRHQSGSGGSEKRGGKQSLGSWAWKSRNLCFSRHPPSWHPQKRSKKRGPLPLVFSFVISLVRSYLQGKARADGKGKLATCRHRADSGGETVKKCAAIVYISYIRV